MAGGRAAPQVGGPERDLHSGNDGGVFNEPLADLTKVLASLIDSRNNIQVPPPPPPRVHAPSSRHPALRTCGCRAWRPSGGGTPCLTIYYPALTVLHPRFLVQIAPAPPPDHLSPQIPI